MRGQAAFDKLVMLAALCRGETAENGNLEGNVETELNGVEEGRDEMSDEQGDGEERLAGPRNKPTQKGGGARSNTRAVLEKAMRIASVKQIELDNIMELSITSQVLKWATQSNLSGAGHYAKRMDGT